MRILLKGGLLAVGALALMGQHDVHQEGADDPDNGRKLTATLTGANEVPGPGDTTGGGVFEARVNPGQGRICYTLDVTGIEVATMAHIHLGAAGVAGDPVVTLEAPTENGGDDANECQDIDRSLAQALIQNSGEYYVNVHNADFPNGAIRGQLQKG